MSSDRPRVVAVVLARDRPVPTQATIDGLLAQDDALDTVVLIDNDATPDVRAILEATAAESEKVLVLPTGRNLGCAGGFEFGLHHILDEIPADFVIGFDDDATPLPGCVAALVAAAETLPTLGAAGAVSHAPDGTLAWPMHIEGEAQPAHTTADVAEIATRRRELPVHNLSWHGLLFPVSVLRAHGLPWGDLFLQYEDIELGMRLRKAGLRSYLVPGAECLHPAPPPARQVSILGRHIDVTRQRPAKEYLSLRNGLVVRRRHDGLRFWYGTGPFVILRGILTAFAVEMPTHRALRRIVFQGIADAVRGRLGPPPPSVSDS